MLCGVVVCGVRGVCVLRVVCCVLCGGFYNKRRSHDTIHATDRRGAGDEEKKSSYIGIRVFSLRGMPLSPVAGEETVPMLQHFEQHYNDISQRRGDLARIY